jgi:hypothetical protein
MAETDEWIFEAWRKCTACDGTGRTQGPGRQWQISASGGLPDCPTCNPREDGTQLARKRPGWLRKEFTLADLKMVLR